MEISKLDHLVLTVKDMEKTVLFYENVLGMERVVFGDGRLALNFGDQKINLHQMGNEFEPKAHFPVPGSADLCFISITPIKDAMEHVERNGVKILEGPVHRIGAKGPLLSFYFRDPDNNLIEVANERYAGNESI